MTRRLAICAGVAAALVVSGCSDEEAVSPVDQPVEGDLSVDIRDTAHVRLDGRGPDIQVSVTLSSGHGVCPDGTELSGKGRLEAFPEAEMTLITARLDAPPTPGGPCGEAPVSLALSLHRRDGASRVGGALTAYCGQGSWTGVPARVLRVSGDLP